jgi:hypothetical protein
VSPITPDYVNPEFSWPEIEKIEENSKNAGYELKCRFPIYPEFFSFLDKKLRDKMKDIEDEYGNIIRRRRVRSASRWGFLNQFGSSNTTTASASPSYFLKPVSNLFFKFCGLLQVDGREQMGRI